MSSLVSSATLLAMWACCAGRAAAYFVLHLSCKQLVCHQQGSIPEHIVFPDSWLDGRLHRCVARCPLPWLGLGKALQVLWAEQKSQRWGGAVGVGRGGLKCCMGAQRCARSSMQLPQSPITGLQVLHVLAHSLSGPGPAEIRQQAHLHAHEALVINALLGGQQLVAIRDAHTCAPARPLSHLPALRISSCLSKHGVCD